jgi:hypothetical protein
LSLCEFELELSAKEESEPRFELLRDVASAHRLRAAYLNRRGQARLAAADQERALELDRQARTLKERLEARKSTGTGRPAVAETRDSAKPGALTGPLTLTNNYVEPVTIHVNDRSYSVPVGKTVTLAPLPPGRFTYEVVTLSWGSRGLQVRYLNPDEPFTVVVR